MTQIAWIPLLIGALGMGLVAAGLSILAQGLLLGIVWAVLLGTVLSVIGALIMWRLYAAANPGDDRRG